MSPRYFHLIVTLHWLNNVYKRGLKQHRYLYVFPSDQSDEEVEIGQSGYTMAARTAIRRTGPNLNLKRARFSTDSPTR